MFHLLTDLRAVNETLELDELVRLSLRSPDNGNYEVSRQLGFRSEHTL